MKQLNKTNPFKTALAALAVYASRFGLMPLNFSPLGSFGFFSGNLFFYAATIIGFDFLKGGFYKGFEFTYLGFLGYFILGKLAKNSWKKQALFLPLASFLFFVLSNFGSWYFWYPRNLTGLMTCYLVALPFYRNTLLGDLAFGYGFMAMRSLSLGKTGFSLYNMGLFFKK